MSAFLDQGIFQTVRMVDKIKPEPAFDAQMSIIGRRLVHPGDPDNPIADLFQKKLTAHAAVGTGGFDPLQFPGAGQPMIFSVKAPVGQ